MSDKGGTLSVSWSRHEDVLSLQWVETCHSPIAAPSDTPGFGTRLLDMLPYIDVSRDYRPEGLQMVITVSGEKAFA